MEYKFKGTPGPWHPVEYAGHINIQDEPFYCGKDLLDADNIGYETMNYNAHLISAAPELLEACIDTLRVIGEETPHSKQVKAAIQKALNI